MQGKQNVTQFRKWIFIEVLVSLYNDPEYGVSGVSPPLAGNTSNKREMCQIMVRNDEFIDSGYRHNAKIY